MFLDGSTNVVPKRDYNFIYFLYSKSRGSIYHGINTEDTDKLAKNNKKVQEILEY